jgi:hypothetical protein
MAANGFTPAEFRAARRMTVAKFAALERDGLAPNITKCGRSRIITPGAAAAWDEAEARRMIDALTFAAQIGADDPVGGAE